MSFNKCFLHSEDEYKFICFENHECQKKLCIKCFSEHQPSNYQTIDDFLQKSSEIFSTLQETQNMDSKFEEIKKNVADAESPNQKLHQTFLESLDRLLCDLKTLNFDYFNIKQKLFQKNIEIFSNTELQMLTETGLIDQISAQNIFNQICLDKIFHNAQELVQQLKQDNTFILSKISSKNEAIETQELLDCKKKRKIRKISLIGKKIFGMMHGQYYYQIENHEKVLKTGGMYFLDQKIGYWSELNQKYENYHNKVFYLRDDFPMGKRLANGNQVIMVQGIIYQEVSFECQYNNIGQKQGECQDIIVFIQNSGCIIKSGNYNSGVKRDNWETSYLNKINNLQKIGGGKYNENGQKIGNWIDFNESEFKNNSQLIQQGEYQAGVKVRKWKISFRSDDGSYFRQIGGGKYDEQGQKIGKWVDINESEFKNNSQVIWQGEYQAGVKVGEWNSSFRSDHKFDFKQIGGGKYDKQGQKIGKWIDINESKFQNNSQVIWHGEYKAGVKVGEWKISFRLNDWYDFKQIGGGTYDEQGQKIGKWIDINESEFKNNSQVIWQGEYQAGVKVRKWKINFRSDDCWDFKQIGGGNYDEQGQKIEEWVDINESEFRNHCQIIWQGDYQTGVKVGEWKIYFRSNDQSDLNSIGGGKFDEQGQKIGKWIDINESEFKNNSQVIWQGEYQAGVKVRKWKINFRSDDCWDFKQIGGGNYDEQGQKIEEWVDINESEFRNHRQIIWQGDYQAGVKVGEWKIYFRSNDQSDLNQIGGGKYDEQGQKIGKWVDIDESEFKNYQCFIWHGEYQAGVKVGEWKSSFRSDERSNFKQIGGGKYDENGQKTGKWIDIDESQFAYNNQVIWQGEYQANAKVGVWEISFRSNDESDFKQIGGGKYDENGQKTGKWIDIDESYFAYQNGMIRKGEYQAGVQVGEWDISSIPNDWSQFQEMDGGQYDYDGQIDQ